MIAVSYTHLTPVFAQYRKVTLADIPNATVTARGAFYPNSDGTGSTFTALSEKGAGYVYAELDKDPTVTLSVRDMSLGSQLQVKNNGNGIGSPLRSGDSLAISVKMCIRDSCRRAWTWPFPPCPTRPIRWPP